MEQCWLNFVFMRGEGGNVVSSRVGTYKIYKRQDKASSETRVVGPKGNEFHETRRRTTPARPRFITKVKEQSTKVIRGLLLVNCRKRASPPTFVYYKKI